MRAGIWSRVIPYTIVGAACAALLVHAVGWGAAVSVLWRDATPHVPRIQSAIVLSLGLCTIRVAASARRRTRRLVVVTALTVALVAFVVAPLPQQFEGNGIMADGVERASSRERFEQRFPLARDAMNFHSHLGDLLMVNLDRAFGSSGESTGLAYATLSRAGGLLFLIELFLVAAWHRWSRRVCRYAGLAIASPVCLLFFGYWELGYLSMSAGVVPLLVLGFSRRSNQASAATLLAGFVQGLHTALHGFGMLGLAGAILASLSGPGEVIRKVLRGATLASAGVAMYLGWIFVYVAEMNLSIVADRQFGFRPLFEPLIFDRRIADPLFSYAGLGDLGLVSMLAGVPLLALAAIRSPRSALVTPALFAFPGLIFLIRWWPVGAPYNLDLLLAAFPGLFAACWLVASSRQRTMAALVLLLILHALLWTTIGGTAFDRVWVEPSV